MKKHDKKHRKIGGVVTSSQHLTANNAATHESQPLRKVAVKKVR